MISSSLENIFPMKICPWKPSTEGLFSRSSVHTTASYAAYTGRLFTVNKQPSPPRNMLGVNAYSISIDLLNYLRHLWLKH